MNEACSIRSVLIVDADPALVQAMEEHLRRSNFSTTVADTHTKALAVYEKVTPDTIIVDLDSNQDNGREFLRDLRSRGDVPIIVIGNGRNDNDKVVWLEFGADEYLTKPLSTRELLVRIKSLGRRCFPARLRNTQSGRWLFGGWELCLKTKQLREPSGELVHLTRGEYALLVAFLEAALRPLSRECLQQATRVHGDIFDRSIDVQILRLRRKLELDAGAPQLIKTVRGVGYKFSIPAERA
ncbi:response regulator [Ensifer aridi]|uniref:response regulator n=1 Tax=Ensifer aridi TaxID=1708715 RepID=UPI000A0FE12B|nr:response regulator [Ensifer aridi]